MTDKYVITREDYDAITGITTVTINTHIGQFTGTTKIDEIDAEYPSVFQGHEIALAKALRKYAAAACIVLKNEIKTLSSMIKQAFTHSSKVTHPIKIMIATRKERQKELELWKRRIEVLSQRITNRIATRDRLVKKYSEKKDQQD